MTPTEKVTLVKTRIIPFQSADDLIRIAEGLARTGFTGKLIVNFSQGGVNSLITEEKLKPPS
jgi:hypothetical protein